MSSLVEKRRKMEVVETMDKLIQSYQSLPVFKEYTKEPFDNGSICTASVLMSLFGPEDISLSDPVGYGEITVFWEKVEDLVDERGWSWHMPSSAYEFASTMEDGEKVVGALIVNSQFREGAGDVGHVMAILRSWARENETFGKKIKRRWVEGKKKPDIERMMILFDTSRLLGGRIMEIDFDGLIDLYTEAMILDGGERAIVILIED
jgi:hypothetical protein